MNKKLLLPIIILLLVFSLSVFSMAFTYKVISHFKDSNVYNSTLFAEDIEISIVIMCSILISKLLFLTFLIKKKVINLKKQK